MNGENAREFHTTRRVEFCHTDAAGIAHFSALLVFMEQAEHDFWRALNRSVHLEIDGAGRPLISWPRVRMESDFQGVARFEDLIDIYVSLKRIGSKSLTFAFRLERERQLIATGMVTTVCCLVSNGQVMSQAIPQDLIPLLEPFVVPENA